MNTHTHPDYDLHMPKIFAYPFQVGIGTILLTIFVFILLQKHPVIAGVLGGISLLAGIAYVTLVVIVKRFTNLERRLKGRDRFLAGLPLQGHEMILDVGCGNGILLLEAAKRLTTGQGIGIDVWTEGSGENRPEKFQENAEIEGVADRVSLQNEDMRRLPYDDASFDLIMSGLTMHHLSSGADYKKALGEMARVLKPGGRLAIYDEPFTVFFCARLLRKEGLDVEKKEKDMVFGRKRDPRHE